MDPKPEIDDTAAILIHMHSPISTPRLTSAMQSGDSNTAQLLEIAANEIPRGDLRDLLLGAASHISLLNKTLSRAVEAYAAERQKSNKEAAAA